MGPKDFDDFMRRVNAHIAALEERVALLEEVESGFDLGSFGYEDIRVSIAQLRIPPSQAPTWRTWDYGIVSGVLFPILGFDLNELVYVFIQTAHAMELQSALDYHIHWSIPSNSTGDRIRFQVDAIAAGIDGTWAVVPGSPFTAEYILDGSESGKHKLLDVAEMDGVNTTVSSGYVIKLTRIAATVSDYSPEVYLVFTDGHYKMDSLGSEFEDSK